jgi:putative membrane protein
MMRFLAQSALTLLANAVGLVIASLVLTGFHINILGFIVSVLFFTGVEILFEPFVLKMALKYMPALRGGIALVTTLVGLMLTVMFTSGLQIDNLQTWVMAPLIIWLSVILAGIVLPLFLFKTILEEVQSDGKDRKDSDDEA